VHYMQTVVDGEDNSFIHKEPGLWLHIPKTKEGGESYVRHATIPHGTSLAAQTTFFTTVNGGPDIKPVNSLPFPLSDPIPALNDITHKTIADPKYIAPYLNDSIPTECLPAGLNAAQTIKDPTEVLRAQIKRQEIAETAVLSISTASLQNGGIVNIPFLTQNANAAQMDAIFWIERVRNPTKNSKAPNPEYMQVQYVQRVILDFAGVHWPHISVATLAKAA
ncbi:MAG TPA: heme-binding protein, partial [Candidatus Sulfotelmatobacter sp.]|nr:heme-binding protein [Candidatus Sulfotelmatobacter sp.]